DPTGFIPTLLGDVREHPVPLLASFGIVIDAVGVAVSDKTELAIGDDHVTRRPLGHEAAIRAWLTAESERAALAALEQTRNVMIKACLMRWSFSTQIGIQRPFDMILRQAMAEDGTTMIEDYTIGFAVSRTQPAADHLAIQSHLFGGPSQDD